MKKILIFTTACISFCACKKDSDSNSNPSPAPVSNSCLLTEVRDSSGNRVTSSYEYNANRKLLKENKYSNGVLSGYSTYSYNGNTLTIQDYKTNNQADGSPAIGILNASGYLTSLVSSGPDTIEGTPGIAKDTGSFNYNSSGQMQSYTLRSWTRDAGNTVLNWFSITVNFEYNAGRATKITSSFNSTRGSLTENSSSVDVYTYNENSPIVKSNPAIGFFFLAGTELLGKPVSDRIPVKSDETYTDIEGNSSNGIKTFSAIIDSKGYPTKIRTRSDLGGGSFFSTTTQYTYTCP